METTDVSELLRQAPLRLIAARIRKARKTAGPDGGKLSLDELAAAAGTSRQHLINLEHARSRPRAPMLERIAEATSRPVDFFLVGGAGEPDPFLEEAA